MNASRRRGLLAVSLCVLAMVGLVAAIRNDAEPPTSTVGSGAPLIARPVPDAPAAGTEMDLRSEVVRRPWSYIPPQCYTATEAPNGEARNPCYACHHEAREPNFIEDAELQTTWDFAAPAAVNPWPNLFADRRASADAFSDAEIDAYVANDNYFDEDGETITLARVLEDVPAGWDFDGDGTWEGYQPDCYFDFDAEGFDRDPSGAETGWRAFAYYPFLGTFFPTNGSTDDVLIRLAAPFRERADGTGDRSVYKANLAIVEAVIRQTDVPIAPTDEAVIDVDLDGDGVLGTATRVAYRPEGLMAAGRAAIEIAAERIHLTSGRYPEGTEFLHSVRYLGAIDGQPVAMAQRMKELRYMIKTGHLNDRQLRNSALAEVSERERFPERLREIPGNVERGVSNGQGWRLQGFIEDARGELRPQTYEESVFCVGCHAGIGAITDGTFAFPRRLSADAHQEGWYHWSQRGLAGTPEPVRADGDGEYSTYVMAVRGGDEFRGNQEVVARFFDASGAPRPEPFAALRRDITVLLLPSVGRARDLNRAYRVTVAEQSYWRGRDAIVSPVVNVHERVQVGGSTGVTRVRLGPGRRIGLP